MTAHAIVPRAWVGETAVLLATGPSLCAEDVQYCRGRAKVLAIKDAITLAPWADVLYGCGADSGRWWPTHGESLRAFTGLRYTLDPKAATWADVLTPGAMTGLSANPHTLNTGKNSGYQAINLAVLLGATTIVLLGYDLQPAPDGRQHFHGDHPWATAPLPYAEFLKAFPSLIDPLTRLGVRVVNSSRQTALTCFPRVPLAEVLA